MTAPDRSATPTRGAPRPARGGARPWRTFTRRGLLYAIVALVGFLGGYLAIAFFVFPPQLVQSDARIPNVVGLLYDDAVARLSAAGFTAIEGERRFNEVAPPQTVLAQSPPPLSREARGAKITLDLSAGQRRLSVPPIVGLTRALAQSALENAGLELGAISERESDAPNGAVLESVPSVGTGVSPSTRVALVLSKGPSLIAVPDLVGRDLATSRQMLEQIGLVVGAITIDSTATTEAPNTILGQNPLGGNKVRTGTMVSLKVSAGQPQ